MCVVVFERKSSACIRDGAGGKRGKEKKTLRSKRKQEKQHGQMYIMNMDSGRVYKCMYEHPRTKATIKAHEVEITKTR